MTDVNNGASSSTGAEGSQPSAKQMISETKQAAQDQVAGLTSKVQDTAKEQLTKHQETASRTLGDFADAIRKAGDELSSKDQSTVSRVVKQAADSLEGLSRSLSDKQPGELLDAVRDYGRKNPIPFIAGAALLGLAVARFAKSSASRTASSGSTGSSYGGGSRSYASDTPARSTSGFYETAGAATTAPAGSGTGIDPTLDPFDTASPAGANTVGLGSLDDGLSGGVQGAQL